MKKITGDNFPFDTSLRKKFSDEYELKKILLKMEEMQGAPSITRLRLFSSHINARKKQKKAKEFYSPAELHSIGLIQEIYRYISSEYEKNEEHDFWKKFASQYNAERRSAIFSYYIEQYPPLPVYEGIISEPEYKKATKDGETISDLITEDLLLLTVNSDNPALKPYREIFDDTELHSCCRYREYVQGLTDYLKELKPIGPNESDLYSLFLEPIQDSPDSIFGQLEYILKHWSKILPDQILRKLLKTFDILREEFLERGSPGGEKATFSPDYSDADLYPEYEAFSEDKDWMPRVVMLAKSTYVWLFQLSAKYGREITRLDQIPDEELDRISRWGFTGLWLIGLWERSDASRHIKNINGNSDAMASAYSLYDYTIAERLGGEEALQSLKLRCASRGIRLAADMVPNHFGIYSRWVIEHPERFLSLDYSPYPHYRFHGENLSHDPRVGLYLEDGYYDKSDAAVVFKRVDFHTGAEKYIYHGNDGTTMPWNDTAQINYLNPGAREAIIRIIIEVAKRFPIIRFDAAMTLANKHIQRLWFPAPGTGGAIPSRAEQGMSPDEFKKHMPVEFWREVVDRVAKEAPDTLLLAEAFWLMEGYFVRTLGMHRVYNSAFMNMLMKEENQKYRYLIKETMEFNPQILKRYVNFMSNPDEETAVHQFSKGDKYFGVTLLMVTLPGLPMFAHGQIEGFSEKYGMEYYRPYFEEDPDQWLVERHEKEIFPLIRKRYLFSGVSYFTFYDFFTLNGWIDENVFAYSNMSGGERALIIYNNRYGDTHGYVHASTGINAGNTDNPEIVQRTLFEGLELSANPAVYSIFQDQRSGLQYIRSNDEIKDKGLFVILGAYQAHSFINFREVTDENGEYARLAARLNGNGVSDMDESLHELKLEPILAPLKNYLNAPFIKEAVHLVQELGSKKLSSKQDVAEITALFEKNKFREKVEEIAARAGAFSGCNAENNKAGAGIAYEEISVTMQRMVNFTQDLEGNAFAEPIVTMLRQIVPEKVDSLNPVFWRILFITVFLSSMGHFCPGDRKERSILWFKEWMLHKFAQKVLLELGASPSEAEWESMLIEILMETKHWEYDIIGEKYPFIRENIYKGIMQKFLKIHSFEGVLWFDKTNFEFLIRWSLVNAYFSLKNNSATFKTKYKKAFETLSFFEQTAFECEYKFLDFIQKIDPQTKKPLAAKVKKK